MSIALDRLAEALAARANQELDFRDRPHDGSNTSRDNAARHDGQAYGLREALRLVRVGQAAAERLGYLRAKIIADQISYGEIAELQSLAEHIDPDDFVLLSWAMVPGV